MSDIQAAVFIMRGQIQLGITVEDFRETMSNPDMSADELATLLRGNSDRIRELLDREHER
jgi:hypothetical protein